MQPAKLLMTVRDSRCRTALRHQLLESLGNKQGRAANKLSHEASDGRKTTCFSSKQREETLEFSRGGESPESVLKDLVSIVECCAHSEE